MTDACEPDQPATSDLRKILSAAVYWFIAGFCGLFGVIAAATAVDLLEWLVRLGT